MLVKILVVGESASYSIGTTTFVEADIHDNDDPTLASINVVPVSGTVAEAASAMAQFNVTATTTTGNTTPIDIELMISQEGDFLQNAAGTRTGISVTPAALGSETAAVHREPIADDSDYEADGKIIAKIVNSTLYSVGANAIAEVTVTNDDPIPAITISGANQVGEGDSGTTDYDFTVNLTQSSAEDDCQSTSHWALGR